MGSLRNLNKFKPGQSGNPSGRPKGSPNKASLYYEVAKICHEEKCNPFKVLCWLANNDIDKLGSPRNVGLMTRKDAASELAGYLAPKLKAIQHSGDNENPLKVTINLA